MDIYLDNQSEELNDDSIDELSKQKGREKKLFKFIKGLKEFNDLLKKEKKNQKRFSWKPWFL